jgi:hypothetical protein
MSNNTLEIARYESNTNYKKVPYLKCNTHSEHVTQFLYLNNNIFENA